MGEGSHWGVDGKVLYTYFISESNNKSLFQKENDSEQFRINY